MREDRGGHALELVHCLERFVAKLVSVSIGEDVQADIQPARRIRQHAQHIDPRRAHARLGKGQVESGWHEDKNARPWLRKCKRQWGSASVISRLGGDRVCVLANPRLKARRQF
jgi:hypothetical protein